MGIKFYGIIVLSLILLLSVFFSIESIAFNNDALKEILPTLGFLVAISLFMERSIEVFLSTWRGGEADLKDLAIKEKTKELNELRELNKGENEINTKISELESLNEERTEYRIKSREIALWTGLIFGIIIASIGIHTLEFLVDPQSFKEIKDSTQGKIFNIVDVVLTGSVLAGGSEGINKLTKVYTNYMQTTSDKVKSKNA